ncbi:MAG: 30S ribosome-binding factor RbfA [Planctomycetota bacterium]|nr:30S ribosome-binding factor RbfA [Planctomycetota bacterium]
MTHRAEQVASNLSRAIQEILVRGLADPRVKGSITVIGCRVSQDLRSATVLVSILPEEEEDLTMHGLRSAARHIRRQVGDKVDMARVPDLHFKLDKSLKTQAEVLDLIARASRELSEPPRTGGWSTPESESKQRRNDAAG